MFKIHLLLKNSLSGHMVDIFLVHDRATWPQDHLRFAFVTLKSIKIVV